jgi:hypothetical protein
MNIFGLILSFFLWLFRIMKDPLGNRISESEMERGDRRFWRMLSGLVCTTVVGVCVFRALSR